MGQQLKKKKKLTELERMLSETYLNTDLNFSSKEITQLNLRMKDSKNYFNTSSFTYYLYFNHSFFQDWINVLYENYSNKIESFNSASSSSSPFLLLVDFDDELEGDEPVEKLDYEPLFTIIFEKLEISMITFFSLTNYNKHLTAELLSQLYENCYLLQLNRKFDSLCFLLSNTDYFIKDNSNIIFFGIKQPYNTITSMYHVYHTEHSPKVTNEYMYGVYHNYYFESFLYSSKDGKCQGFNYFKKNILKQISPSYIKWSMVLDMSLETALFVKSNNALFEINDAVLTASSVVIISAKVINVDSIARNPNFVLVLKNMLTTFNQSSFQSSLLVVKIYYEVKGKCDKNKREIEAIHEIIRNMINESFAYRYSNSHPNHKRKLIIEVYQVLFNRRVVANDTNIEDVKLMDVFDCIYNKEKSWHYWFIDQKDRRKRDWTSLYILFTNQLRQIGKVKHIFILIDKYLTLETKFNSTFAKETGKMKEIEFLFAFYS